MENPAGDRERPHYLKYSLFYGYPGKPFVIYDNERGKGDHRHYFDENGVREEAYRWQSVEQLVADFSTDIRRLRGDDDE